MGGQTDLGLLIAFKNLGFALTLIFPYNPLPLIFRKSGEYRQGGGPPRKPFMDAQYLTGCRNVV